MECEFCKKDLDLGAHSSDCPLELEGMTTEATLTKMFNTGWTCPSCKRVYSPMNNECNKCNEGL